MEEMRDGELERTGRPDGAAPARDAQGMEERAGAGSDDEEVRRRAYERYLSRGDAPGSEVDDWLEAEREVRDARAEGAADAPEGGEAARGTPNERGRGRR
jgi:hypothetical protein